MNINAEKTAGDEKFSTIRRRTSPVGEYRVYQHTKRGKTLNQNITFFLSFPELNNAKAEKLNNFLRECARLFCHNTNHLKNFRKYAHISLEIMLCEGKAPEAPLTLSVIRRYADESGHSKTRKKRWFLDPNTLEFCHRYPLTKK